MIWLLILKMLTLFEAGLDYFVNGTVRFDYAPDGQWVITSLNFAPTAKGQAILADIATIIHNGLDFIAQFMTLLPVHNGLVYNTMAPLPF
jgi:hypothetical protein